MSDVQLYVIVNDGREWIDDLVQSSVRERFSACVFVDSVDELPLSTAPLLQFSDGAQFCFEHVLSHPKTSLLNLYTCNSALTRKSHLSRTVDYWKSKHPNSILYSHVPEGVAFELDYAEYLEDALDEAFEIHQSFKKNTQLAPAVREWWILKGNLMAGGHGHGLFSTMDQLRDIFETVYADEPDGRDGSTTESANPHCDLYTSQVREFIAQRYLDEPLLCSDRKFHIRTYVLAVGWLKVFVSREMLCLSAQETYCHPSVSSASDIHLTNTAIHQGLRTELAQPFWGPWRAQNLISNDPDSDWKPKCFQDICSIVSEIFEAGARTQPAHFQMLPNTFELFGLDFLVDRYGSPWLLEVNSGPAFHRTSPDMDEIVEKLFSNVVEIAVCGFFCPGEQPEAVFRGMEKVLDIDLAVR